MIEKPNLLRVAGAAAMFLSACAPSAPNPAGTAAMRAELFDTILARVERREAFSEVKNRTWGLDPLQEMRALRDTVVRADTEEALFYALTRLSHARRDRHLHVALVPGGLQLADSAGVEVWGGGDEVEPREAPVRAFPDYGKAGGYFVGDVADGSSLPLPSPGDRIVSVNGMSVDAWEESVRPWTRHSHPAGLRWKMAEGLSVASAMLPPALRSDSLRIEVTHGAGETVGYALPYLPAEALTWRDVSEPRYPGLSLKRSTVTYDLLVPDDGRRFLLLVWTGFRETMVADVDTLMALARREGLLDRAVIVDVTRSGGGSLGPYAVQHLQPKAFKTTFGTLRLSDVVVPFIEEKRRDFAAHDINDGGVPETVDDGSWLMDWLEHDVLDALQTDAVYTAPVPFKLAHAGKDSDGVLPPAPVHFHGAFAVISGPSGGSHLEHTLRPNGEVLEGNPAQVDDWLPLTADGAADYYPRLLDAALAALDLAALDLDGLESRR